ncbi:MAG: ribbon-helix-helix domain-containing protein [Nostoc sp.]
MSKRINVTLPDSVLEDLEIWAASQGRPTANLAAFLIEMSIKLAKNSGEFPNNSSVITSKPQS